MVAQSMRHLLAAKVAEKIKAYEARHGARWKVAALLDKLAASGGKLADAGVKR
jgi:hypothetical protein